MHLLQSGYIGKTQNYLKERTSQHFSDAWDHAYEMRKKHGHNNWTDNASSAGSDAFAKHFAHHVRHAKNKNESKAILNEIVKPSILWQGNRISCMKTAKTLQCKICMEERKTIA